MNEPGTSYEGSLLLTLEEISQLVAHSHHSSETLTNIVRLIQGRFHTAVCSVYFYVPERGELVLGATVGLKSEAIGRVRMRLEEGLTGLVAQQMSPVAVADAFAHPRFKYFPEADEDPYHSFLGVPLLEGGTLQGVLVVQTREPRQFSPSEVRMLVTVAAQLAALVGDALLLDQVSAVVHPAAAPAPTVPGIGNQLNGTSLSPGTGLGRAYVVDAVEEWRRDVPAKGRGVVEERRRLIEAMQRARAEISRLSQHISELVGEDHGAILQAQLMIMQDRTIERDLDACLEGGASAEGALLATLDKYVAALQKVATPFFHERIYDIKDVFHRLLWQLRPRQQTDPSDDRLVLVAREASVMELFAVDLDRLAAVVVEHGGPQSHAAILARSLGIPMVGQLSDFAPLAQSGRLLLVDGSAGTVVLDPAPLCVMPPSNAGLAAKPLRDAEGSRGAIAPLPPGLPGIEVNINLLYEARSAFNLGASGVGLYRSEFLFLARRTLPTEEEQVEIYRKLLHTLAGRPVTIRTFDLRPDKLAACSHFGSTAARPFDWRLVLQSPPLQQLFQDQVRAILRASTVGPVRILVPLVTSSELLDFVLETVARARDSLTAEGLPFAADIPLGVMIEVAAAASLVAAWAEQVSFFAIGTNDLAASALGLDRDDPLLAHQADALHPGLIRLIHDITADAHAADRPVSVCGEIAADPLGALALAALGVDTLSVPVNQLTAARQALAGCNATALAEVKTQLLRQRSTKAVRTLLLQSRPCL
ncbi:MAG TPA: putative PEP-binding protein [Gemmataceae bacterium]|nr:putative PEP-binding protein [Gemmataceae bacterium]